MQNEPLEAIAASVFARLSIQQRNCGGSSESEVTALIVIPWSSPSADVAVTTATPVNQWLAICLKSSGVTLSISLTDPYYPPAHLPIKLY